MTGTISILGCGWLGIPLAKQLISAGYRVNGSVRKKENFEKLEPANIHPYLLTVNADNLQLNDPAFFSCDILIVSIPPGRKDGTAHLFANKIKAIRGAIISNRISKVIFISSTSVYPDNNAPVSENDATDATTPVGRQLLMAEDIMRKNRAYDLTIIRFAGLIGLNRNPVNFLKKGSHNKNANTPMNLIHIDDAVGVIETIIKTNTWNQTFNACADEHPTRYEFYSLAAQLNHHHPPKFETTSQPGYKLVNCNKLHTLTGYRFKYKNPLDYVREEHSSGL